MEDVARHRQTLAQQTNEGQAYAYAAHPMPPAAWTGLLWQPASVAEQVVSEWIEPSDANQQTTYRADEHWPPQAPFLLPTTTAPLVHSLAPVLTMQAHWQQCWKEIAIQQIPKSVPLSL